MGAETRKKTTFATIALLVVAIALSLVGYGWMELNRAFDGLETFGALWFTTDLIIEHIRANDRVPVTWQDLADVYPQVSRGYGDIGIENLKDRIHVNFIDLQRCANSESASLNGTEFVSPLSKFNEAEVLEANRRIGNMILAMKARQDGKAEDSALSENPPSEIKHPALEGGRRRADKSP